MKPLLFTSLWLLFTVQGSSQQSSIKQSELSLTDLSNLDSLEHAVAKMKEDTLKAMALSDLALTYAFYNAQQGVYYGQEGIKLSRKLAYAKGNAYSMHSLAWSCWALGNYSNALQYAIEGLHEFEELNDIQKIGQSYVLFSAIYRDVGDYPAALQNAGKGLAIYNRINVSPRISYANIGSIYELQNRLDSAATYTQMAHQLDVKDNEGKWDWLYWIQGNIEAKQKNYPAALTNYRIALSLAIQTNIYKTIVEANNGIANVYKVLGDLDSSIYYANQVLQQWKTVSYQKGVLDAAGILSDVYKIRKQDDSTIKYLEFSRDLKDKLFNQEITRNIQTLGFSEQIRLDAIERERAVYRDRLKMYAVIFIGLILFTIALALWRNILHRKKAYAQLQMQKAETDLQKNKAERTLLELKSTQSQLIQSEKMASLGTLTAGIAHEIQNPLNFVNNFSEVNSELVDEINNAVDIDEIKAIANDIKQNSEKILFHGKRADAIVKGMLQHSRTSSIQKESTDINALAEEYLRLSYHGLRAKDSSFNATMKTDFDETIGDINIIPQDIGKVLLNLYNNAFYAVNETQKATGDSYEPVVTVTTKKINDKTELRITDNGSGISSEIVDKIFQPFFTTKPTGQGTGLGLSLSYDIVKAHGGELKVETKQDEGSEFIIHLPI